MKRKRRDGSKNCLNTDTVVEMSYIILMLWCRGFKLIMEQRLKLKMDSDFIRSRLLNHYLLPDC